LQTTVKCACKKGMSHFTILDLEMLTGIKAHTIRIWEHRYGIFNPKRNEGKHRFYDDEDLKMVLQVSNLYHAGMRISQIARLKADELSIHNYKLLNTSSNNEMTLQLNHALQAAIAFDEKKLELLLNEMVLDYGLEQATLKVFYPLLEKIGFCWMNSEINPLNEHFVSTRIRNKIISGIDKLGLNQSISNKPTVLFLPVGEQHEIPLLFINYLHKKSNKNAVYLGCDTDLQTVKAAALKNKAQTIWVHLITNFTGISATEYVEMLSQKFEQYDIVCSGAGFGSVESQLHNVTILKSMDEIISKAKFSPSLN
jgi:MerR family transcriptional regulator, light-induced transcriptional regulator